MMMQHSADDVDWGGPDQPTQEELRLSGGLLVEDWAHARHVMYLSTQMFQATKPLHHYGKRVFGLLERAAFLHNTGLMVEARRHHKHSYRLINQTPIPGFTEAERHEVACIARYHRRALPSLDHEEYAALSNPARKRVSAMSALLRVADALDFHHDGRVLDLVAVPERCNSKIWTVRLTTRPLADLDDELERAHDKSDLFERVFDRKLYFVTQE